MVIIRDATVADADSIRDVHVESIREFGPTAYDDEQVAAWAADLTPDGYPIDDDDSRFIVAERDGCVVGFGEVRPEPGEYLATPMTDTAEILAVYVLPDAAGEGVGTRLLMVLERTAGGWGCTALGLRASLNAVPFYEIRDYERVGERGHEFAEGVPGVVVEMRKEL